jgi:signal transduction histidine kinase
MTHDPSSPEGTAEAAARNGEATWRLPEASVADMLVCARDLIARAQAELARPLAAELERIREEERIRLARTVHDDLGQALTGLKMDLSWVRRRLADACTGDHQTALLQKTEAMIALADAAIGTVRRLATELRPVILDQFGLVAAVEWQAQAFEQRTEIRCRLALTPVALQGERATALFRILQEALTNVFRHAEATEVQLALRAEADAVMLEVVDNGKGIPESALADRRSLGLLGMRERAAIVGGTLTVARTPGNGTRVVARVPLRAEERNAGGGPASPGDQA